MLYIKFKINDLSKYAEFQKLYDYMVEIRQPGFKHEEESLEFDWDNMTQEEVNEAIEKLDELLDQELQELKRYKALIPDYADVFLGRYLQDDHEKVGLLGESASSLLNYLEYGFEVDMDQLEKLNEHSGIVKFSTGNFPYGGMERFVIVLKAFDLIPTECFNGFTIYEFDWMSDFEHNALELPEKTKEYLQKSRK